MQLRRVMFLATGLVVHVASARTLIARQGVNLGSETFGSPACGDGADVTVSDCIIAVEQLLAANCASGTCTIPPSPNAQISDIQLSFGSCRVIVGARLGGEGATFDESPVTSAFTELLDVCTQPGAPSGGTDGDPMLFSVDGLLELVFLRSGETGGG
ncbi:hypothetical protein GQ53DRAFT_745037 [Thozetella sp. PMI_491]|nr:hypothetical protein GQ53DRAFT_745037 [Thozetella sp. PMI_491]